LQHQATGKHDGGADGGLNILAQTNLAGSQGESNDMLESQLPGVKANNEIGQVPDATLLPKFEGADNNDVTNKACRICLCDDEEEDNPIVQPCKCSGTMRNVHVKCFKKWICKQIMQKQSSNLLSFYWKKLQCELCHSNIHRNYYYFNRESKRFADRRRRNEWPEVLSRGNAEA